MSDPVAATSHSSLLNLIRTAGKFPLAERAGSLVTRTATAMQIAIEESPQNRFMAIVIATMVTAGTIWGVQFLMGRLPIYFVKKTLIPTIEFATKAGLAWVIFEACKASVREMRGTRPAHDSHGSDPHTPPPPSDPFSGKRHTY